MLRGLLSRRCVQALELAAKEAAEKEAARVQVATPLCCTLRARMCLCAAVCCVQALELAAKEAAEKEAAEKEAAEKEAARVQVAAHLCCKWPARMCLCAARSLIAALCAGS